MSAEQEDHDARIEVINGTSAARPISACSADFVAVISDQERAFLPHTYY